MGNVIISIANLPGTLCYSNPQQDWPLLVSYLTANLSGTLNTFNVGNSVPSADNRDKPWIRTNSDGTPDALYQYSGGYWLSKHPLPTGLVCMYEGTDASIDAFDGGETAAITNISGPFWEKVTEMEAKSPIMPGTLESGTVLSIGNNYGEEKHTLLSEEMPRHTHTIQAWTSGATGGDGGQILNQPDPGTEVEKTTGATGGREGESNPDPFTIIHPVRTIFFLRRTSRIYRRI